MKHENWIFYAISFTCWLLPFAIRVFLVEIPDMTPEQLEKLPKEHNSAAQEVIRLLSTENREGAFWAIFKNNLKGCVINITGGVFFGLGTLFNLVFNGFFSADMFASSYRNGMSIPAIL
ncbi:MAG: stage II sporulation protein M, partial [Dysgonamonadaceae bacterium]|nr:stage II sporulation protein M [Dysgonamonadaceae bacterium]